MPKLTKRFVESLKPDENKPIKTWDSELKGFGLIIYPSGRRTYCLEYRNTNRIKKRLKIGVHGHISTEMAREQARQLLGTIAMGADPASDKKKVSTAPTMERLCREYMELHAKVNKRESSQYNDNLKINKVILPALGKKQLPDISSYDIQKIHKSLSDKPYMANRIRSLLSKMFELAIEWGWHDKNPVSVVKKYQEHKRTRWLDETEMERLISTLDMYHNPVVATAIKLILFTGSRKSEVLSATWEQFDLEKGVWIKPAQNTKQKREERLPLSSATIELLREWKSYAEGIFLFPGRIEGGHLQDVKGAWATIRKDAKLNDVRIHDLRHTYASHLVSNGMSLSIVGKLLGHTQASTTQRYAHLADEPLRQAAELFGNKVTGK